MFSEKVAIILCYVEFSVSMVVAFLTMTEPASIGFILSSKYSLLKFIVLYPIQWNLTQQSHYFKVISMLASVSCVRGIHAVGEYFYRLCIKAVSYYIF